MNIYDAARKCRKVIDSCQTVQQLKTAVKYYELFLRVRDWLAITNK